MESDIKKIIKNSKSIKFNKEKFDKYKTFIECATIDEDRHLKTLINKKAYTFAKRLSKMYKLQWNEHRCISVFIDGTPYAKLTSKVTAGISKYYDSDDTFAVVSIPVMRIDSRSYYSARDALNESCDYTCLKCGEEIEFAEYIHYSKAKTECTIYELMDNRFECVCKNCNNMDNREFAIIDKYDITSFLRNLSN